MNNKYLSYLPVPEKNSIKLSLLDTLLRVDLFSKTNYLKDLNNRIHIESDKKYAKNVFIAEHEALKLPTEFLIKVFKAIHLKMKNVEHINMFASTNILLKKPVEELEKLKTEGLSTLYQDIYSGYEIFNGSELVVPAPKNQINAAKKVHEAGINLSQTLSLGYEEQHYIDHANEMAERISFMQPESISLFIKENNSYMQIFQHKKLADKIICKNKNLLKELRLLIENLELKKCLLLSNYSFDSFSFRMFLPEQKNYIIALLDELIAHQQKVIH